MNDISGLISPYIWDISGHYETVIVVLLPLLSFHHSFSFSDLYHVTKSCMRGLSFAGNLTYGVIKWWTTMMLAPACSLFLCPHYNCDLITIVFHFLRLSNQESQYRELRCRTSLLCIWNTTFRICSVVPFPFKDIFWVVILFLKAFSLLFILGASLNI